MSGNISTDNIDVNTFCDVQGVPTHHRHTLNILHKNNIKKTYDQWFELLKTDFSLIKKSFDKTKPAETNIEETQTNK